MLLSVPPKMIIRPRLESNAAAPWCIVKIDAARCRLKAVGGIFGVDAALHGVEAWDCAHNIRRKRLASGDADLLFYEIASINLLGNRVFHLNACVHFHEIEMLVLIQQEFDCASVLIAD